MSFPCPSIGAVRNQRCSIHGAGGTVNNLPPGSFPTEAFNLLAAQVNAGIGVRLAYVQPNPKRNYVMQWNLNVQRELSTQPHSDGRLRGLTRRTSDISCRRYQYDAANTDFCGLPLAVAMAVGRVAWQPTPTVGRMDTVHGSTTHSSTVSKRN